mmetsp:Transcript_79284/g.220439  ORF Transcript_79284/g.220439 Transcript_79284/m.220439 type:complete len:295 (-) Transcript_79284:323-1207(-)
MNVVSASSLASHCSSSDIAPGRTRLVVGRGRWGAIAASQSKELLQMVGRESPAMLLLSASKILSASSPPARPLVRSRARKSLRPTRLWSCRSRLEAARWMSPNFATSAAWKRPNMSAEVQSNSLRVIKPCESASNKFQTSRRPPPKTRDCLAALQKSPFPRRPCHFGSRRSRHARAMLPSSSSHSARNSSSALSHPIHGNSALPQLWLLAAPPLLAEFCRVWGSHADPGESRRGPAPEVEPLLAQGEQPCTRKCESSESSRNSRRPSASSPTPGSRRWEDPPPWYLCGEVFQKS